MAVDLQPNGVAAVSIWTGMLQTERTARVIAPHLEQYSGFSELAETPQFTGRLIVAFHRDPQRMLKSGSSTPERRAHARPASAASREIPRSGRTKGIAEK
jgi:hypothetical protein